MSRGTSFLAVPSDTLVNTARSPTGRFLVLHVRGHRAARLRRCRPLHRPHPDHLGRPRLLSLERHSSMLRAAVERDSYWAHIGAWDAGAASHRDSSRLSSRLHWSYTTCVMPQAPDDLNQNDCFLSALNVFRCRAHPLLSPNSNVSYYMSRRWLRRMRVVCCMCGMCGMPTHANMPCIGVGAFLSRKHPSSARNARSFQFGATIHCARHNAKRKDRIQTAWGAAPPRSRPQQRRRPMQGLPRRPRPQQRRRPQQRPQQSQ